MSSGGFVRGSIGFLIFANCCNFAVLYIPYAAILLQIVCYIVAAILLFSAARVQEEEEYYAATRSINIDKKCQKLQECHDKK